MKFEEYWAQYLHISTSTYMYIYIHICVGIYVFGWTGLDDRWLWPRPWQLGVHDRAASAASTHAPRALLEIGLGALNLPGPFNAVPFRVCMDFFSQDILYSQKKELT